MPVGLVLGDTENTVVVTDLLADLVARGLRYDHGILAVGTSHTTSATTGLGWTPWTRDIWHIISRQEPLITYNRLWRSLRA